MSSNKDDTIARIKSASGADERARVILESCDCNDSDPEIASLLRHAASGDGEHSRVLASLLRPLKKSRGRNKVERRFDRIRPHHPAMGGLGWKPVKEGPVEKQYGGGPGPQACFNPQPEKPKSETELAFHANFAAYIYENHKKMWPHLPDVKFDPPPGYKPRGPMVNPFWPVAPATTFVPELMRESWLTRREVRKVYNAMSYAMFKDGIIMNTHLIIIWSMMGLSPKEGNAILGKYLHGAQKWLRVGCKPCKRRVAGARTGTELRFAWVHENAPGRGFHSHIVLHLPYGLKKDFELWSRAYLVKLTGRHFAWKAFRLRPSYEKIEGAEVARAWSWFRYLTKELHPQAKFSWIVDEREYRELPMRDIVKPWPYRKNLPVPNMKMTGVSHNIGEGCQRADQFVSKLSRCDFDRLYSGDELEERRQRIQRILCERRTTELLATLQI
jgi:hypothetical protein